MKQILYSISSEVLRVLVGLQDKNIVFSSPKSEEVVGTTILTDWAGLIHAGEKD